MSADFVPDLFAQLFLVAQAETANTVDTQAVDDPPSARFTWTIENFSRLNNKKLYSDTFFVGGYKWYLNVFHLYMFFIYTLYV